MEEGKLEKGPRKFTRRKLLEIGAKLGTGVLLAGVVGELTACKKGKAPEYGTYKDETPTYYTVRLEHGEEEFGHIRKEAHMQGEIIGEIPTTLGLTVDNTRKVHGSSTGAAHEITTYEGDQSTGLWWEGDWPSRQDPKVKIHGYVSSQFTTIMGQSYDKPIE